MQINVPTWLLVAGGIGLLTLLVAAGSVGYWVAPDPEPAPPEFSYEDTVLSVEDLLEGVVPSSVTAHKVPDSSETTQYCSTLPQDLFDPVPTPAPSTGTSNTDELPDSPPSTEMDGVGPTVPSSLPDLNLETTPFIAVPLQDGVPTVSVTADYTRLQGYLPTTGQGVTFNWDAPSKKNAIEIDARTRIWKDGVGATISGAYVRELGALGPLAAHLVAGAGWRGSSGGLGGWYGTSGLRVEFRF